MLKSECQKKQEEEALKNTTQAFPFCTIYYQALGYSRTYNISPSDCSYWTQKANTQSQPLMLPSFKVDPLPTVEPYQYSQEYLDTNAKAMKNLTEPWKPTQIVLPTPVPQEFGGCYGSNHGWINC